MATIAQALTWWSFTRVGLTPDEFVRASVEIGYGGLELAPHEYWSLLRDQGLRIVTTQGHGTLTDGMNKRSNHARIEEEINRNLELAVTWQIPCLIVFSGNRNGLSEQAGLEATVEILRKVAPAAEKAGVTLVLELLNSKVNHPDYQCDHTPWGVEVCKQVNSARVRLLYDIYHMQIMEGDLIRTINDNHQWFGHYHTAGNPGRNELDESQEIYYPAVFRAIQATGYTGWISHEFLPKGDPVAAMRQAFALCQKSV